MTKEQLNPLSEKPADIQSRAEKKPVIHYPTKAEISAGFQTVCDQYGPWLDELKKSLSARILKQSDKLSKKVPEGELPEKDKNYYIESKISRYAKTWKEMDFDKDLDPGFPTYLARATTGFYLEVLRHDLRGGDFFEGAFDQTQKYVCYLHNAAWWLTNGDLETSYALVNCDAHARKTGHQPLYENWIKTITPIPLVDKLHPDVVSITKRFIQNEIYRRIWKIQLYWEEAWGIIPLLESTLKRPPGINKGPTSFATYATPSGYYNLSFYDEINFAKFALRIMSNNVPATKLQELENRESSRLGNYSDIYG